MTEVKKGMRGNLKNDSSIEDPPVILDRHLFLLDIVTDFTSFASFLTAG
jgi:hypothetical protein